MRIPVRPSLVLLVLVGCARQAVPTEPAGSLLGVTLPLEPGPGLGLVVAGSVEGKAALIELDPGSPVSFVSDACLDDRRVVAHVTVADPLGPDETFPVTHLRTLRIGEVLMPPFDAALAEGPRCTVIAGDDLLSGLALTVAVGPRTITFAGSRPEAEWRGAMSAQDEVHLLVPSRDPQHDWPLIPVRFTQGQAQLTGAVVFSARERRSRLLELPAREAGLEPWSEVLEEEATLPGQRRGRQRPNGLALELVELGPGATVSDAFIDLEPGLGQGPLRAALGVVGIDLWGHFNAVIDLHAGAVLLHRPRTAGEGGRPRCARGGSTSEEACFELHGRADGAGLEVSAAVWRALPEGARLSFDVPAARGVCTVGFSFPPGGRGRSMNHVLPWDRLAEVMPECAHALKGATVAPGLVEDGPLSHCPGLCAYAQDTLSGRLSCQCRPAHPALDEDEEQQLRARLDELRRARPAPAGEVEPADP